MIMSFLHGSSQNKGVDKKRRLLLKIIGAGSALSPFKLFGQQKTCPENPEWLIEKSLQIQDKVEIRLYRPQDLLHLGLVFTNFFVNGNKLQSKGAGDTFLIVLFEPQSITEEAYLEFNGSPASDPFLSKKNDIESEKSQNYNSATSFSQGTPAKTYLSAGSRLVYEIPSSIKSIDLTAKGLLDWSNYSLRVNKRASAASILPLFQAADDKPIIINPNILNLKKNPDILRQTNPVKQPEKLQPAKDTTKRNPLLKLFQQKREEPRTAPVNEQRQNPDTAKRQLLRLNQLNRVATKDEQKQIQTTQLPPNEVKTQQQQNDNSGGLLTLITTTLSIGKSPQPLDYLETSIEMPFRLFVSPNRTNAWKHLHDLGHWSITKEFELFKKNKLEIAELWHTRLGVKTKFGIDETPSTETFRTLRALWAVDMCAYPEGKPARQGEFRTALYNDDRHCIVHESSNWQIENYTPQPIKVKRMMMTSLGAWLDSDFDVKREALQNAIVTTQASTKAPAINAGMNLLKWNHLATMARDHYVEVVYAGNIFPFGHEAALVRITERKLEKGYALNKQRFFIIVTEPEKRYNPRTKANKFLGFPFSSVKILTLITPNLSPITKFADISDKQNDHQFIIRTNGNPFLFKIHAIDSEGHEIDFQMPLVFVSTDVTGKFNQSKLDGIIKEYNEQNITFMPELKVANIYGKKVALSKSFIPGDTSFETDNILFGAQFNEDEVAAFSPTILTASIHEVSYQQLTGTKKSTQVVLVDDNNPGKVFLKFQELVQVNFSGKSDKTGGSLNPNFDIKGISKIHGAFGGDDIDKVSNLQFDPATFFAGGKSEAKLFGAIPLGKLMDFIPSVNVDGYVNEINKRVADLDKFNAAGDLASAASKSQEIIDLTKNFQSKIPVLKTFDTGDAISTQYTWEGRIKNQKFGILAFTANVPDKGISIKTVLKKPKNGGAPTLSVESAINDFSIALASIIEVNFQKVGFSVNTNAKTDISVDMKGQPVKFLGPLSFVNKLQQLIPANGFSDPPFLDVTAEGIKTGYTLAVPDVQVGVFSLRHLTLGAMINLPFTGAPLTLRFNFCERHQPFTLTVSALGGGGFLAIELDMQGLRMLEAAIEFGAEVSLNFGVASGSVSVMGGIYFAMEFVDTPEKHTNTKLTGYVRINGEVDVLSLISASIEFYLGLTCELAGDKAGKVWGEASLEIEVEVAFFSKTVSITTRKEFKGADADPTFEMIMSQDNWLSYCNSFAA